MVRQCLYCDKQLSSKRLRREHHKADILEHVYHCQKCQTTFESYKDLKRHHNTSKAHSTETGAPPPDVELTKYCIHCRRSFKNADELNCHFTTAHSDAGYCNVCGKWFSTKSALDSHAISPFHNKEELPCPHCPRLFKTASGVAQHLEHFLGKQVTDTVLEWDTTGQITRLPATLHDEKGVVEAIPNPDDDDDSFVHVSGNVTDSEEGSLVVVKKKEERNALARVMWEVATPAAWDDHLMAFLCPVSSCDQIYPTLLELNKHLRSQDHRSDTAIFACPECDSRFFVVSALIQHLESGSCGLSAFGEVKEIYTGLHDMF
ncbi:hypothetical protein FRC15_007060, partial [Serendipita sp. 397]